MLSHTSIIDSLTSTNLHTINDIILDLKYFIIDHIASGFMAPPVYLLQINLELGSFLKGCSFNQSLTYGNEQVKVLDCSHPAICYM